MKRLLALGVATLAFASAANAAAPQDAISNPRATIANFDVSSLGPILTELGAVWEKKTAQNGQPYVDVSAGGDIVVQLIPTACRGSGFTDCVGLNTVVYFTGKSLNYQTVAAFNQRYWFTTAGIAEDRSCAYISRYEIADYGIARGNVAASVLNLIFIADIFRQELRTSRQTVSLEGYAEDLSARMLNAQGVQALGGDATILMTRHQAALEDMAEFVHVMMADKRTLKNKIDNVTN